MDKKTRTLLIQAALFVTTFFTTTFAGMEWIAGASILGEFDRSDFIAGLYFSIPFLAILTVHEFGHYIVARINKVSVSLPYYIPLWLGGIALSIGTLGAVIRIREKLTSKTKFFDIGIAGPLAGFVLTLFVLWYGFANLPARDYIYDIHPEYEYFGDDFQNYVYDQDTFVLKTDLEQFGRDIPSFYPDTIHLDKDRPMIRVGSTLLFKFFETYVVEDKSRIPDSYELYHYPWLFAGFLALFFTALNLLPIGQLDGGHIVYGLVGQERHYQISQLLFYGLIFYAGLDITHILIYQLDFLQALWSSGLYLGVLFILVHREIKEPKDRITIAVVIFALQFMVSYFFMEARGYWGWMVFAFVISRFVGIKHPPTLNDKPLDMNRQILGWIALLVFIVSVSPRPFLI